MSTFLRRSFDAFLFVDVVGTPGRRMKQANQATNDDAAETNGPTEPY